MTWLDDLEQRLVRAGARGIGQQLADQVGRALGRHEDTGQGDVWDVATHEDERAAGEPPECSWCPLCRAIRLSQSGPGLGGQVSGVADALAGAAQDALDVLDGILSRSGAPRGGDDPGGADPAHDHPGRDDKHGDHIGDPPGDGVPGGGQPRAVGEPGPPESGPAGRGDGPAGRR